MVKLVDLEAAVLGHCGEFLCEQIHNDENTKSVRFRHAAIPATDEIDLPEVGRLQDFYDTFGSIVFYLDEKSGDAARHIAPPCEWAALNDEFSGWFEGLSAEERSESVPEWVNTCLAIGETPESGNYILMAMDGTVAGHVFEFDHDGLEFTHRADDLVEYVQTLLKPDGLVLTDIASHMRFVEDDQNMVQWWIRELTDNRGNVVST